MELKIIQSMRYVEKEVKIMMDDKTSYNSKSSNNKSNFGDKTNVLSRSKALKIARELLYGEDVINKILNAKTENEINRILVTARGNSLKNICGENYVGRRKEKFNWQFFDNLSIEEFDKLLEENGIDDNIESKGECLKIFTERLKYE